MNQDRIERAIEDIVRGIESEFSALRNQDRYVFRSVLKEAQTLAWDTEWPHLVLPVLAEEHLQRLNQWPPPAPRARPALSMIALVA